MIDATIAPVPAINISFCASHTSPWVPRNAKPAAGSTIDTTSHSTISKSAAREKVNSTGNQKLQTPFAFDSLMNTSLMG